MQVSSECSPALFPIFSVPFGFGFIFEKSLSSVSVTLLLIEFYNTIVILFCCCFKPATS